jgi:hypothetical protein
MNVGIERCRVGKISPQLFHHTEDSKEKERERRERKGERENQKENERKR